MKFYCLPPATYTEEDCADVSSWDYFWIPGNIVSAVSPILGLFEPPVVSVILLFWLCFTLAGTDVWFVSVTLLDKHWSAAQPRTSMIPTRPGIS